MPTFGVIGPDPDGDWFVERIEKRGIVTERFVLNEAYPSNEEAQTAADQFNADPASAPTA